jgi:hypothetical protein
MHTEARKDRQRGKGREMGVEKKKETSKRKRQEMRREHGWGRSGRQNRPGQGDF